jgi:hypothetical protein
MEQSFMRSERLSVSRGFCVILWNLNVCYSCHVSLSCVISLWSKQSYPLYLGTLHPCCPGSLVLSGFPQKFFSHMRTTCFLHLILFNLIAQVMCHGVQMHPITSYLYGPYIFFSIQITSQQVLICNLIWVSPFRRRDMQHL